MSSHKHDPINMAFSRHETSKERKVPVLWKTTKITPLLIVRETKKPTNEWMKNAVIFPSVIDVSKYKRRKGGTKAMRSTGGGGLHCGGKRCKEGQGVLQESRWVSIRKAGEVGGQQKIRWRGRQGADHKRGAETCGSFKGQHD